MDKGRFEQLWSRCAVNGSGADARFAEIERHYLESHRTSTTASISSTQSVHS
jgi:hypothetical protein